MSKFKEFIEKTFHSQRLNIVGVKYAGKSQILQTLGCPNITAGNDTMVEIYKKFPIDFSPIGINRKTFIHGGKDFGGELQIFKEQYAKSMRQGDYVLFVIDAEKFVKNEVEPFDNVNYQMAVFQRLDVINRNTPIKKIDKFHVVLTHADLLADREKFRADFQRKVNSDALKSISKWICHYYIIDARDKKEVLNVFERITRR